MLSLLSQPLSTTAKLLRCDPQRVNASTMASVLGISSQSNASRNKAVRDKAKEILCIGQDFTPENLDEPEYPENPYDVFALGRFFEPIARTFFMKNFSGAKCWKQPNRICAMPPLPMACSPDLLGEEEEYNVATDTDDMYVFGVEIKVPAFRSLPQHRQEIYPEHIAQCLHSLFCCPGIEKWVLFYYDRFEPKKSVYYDIYIRPSQYEFLLLDWTKECFKFLQDAQSATSQVASELENSCTPSSNPSGKKRKQRALVSKPVPLEVKQYWIKRIRDEAVIILGPFRFISKSIAQCLPAKMPAQIPSGTRSVSSPSLHQRVDQEPSSHISVASTMQPVEYLVHC